VFPAQREWRNGQSQGRRSNTALPLALGSRARFGAPYWGDRSALLFLAHPLCTYRYGLVRSPKKQLAKALYSNGNSMMMALP
jgi:hypothetical protein